MRFNGKWLLCDDGAVRPVIQAEILRSNGIWQPVVFLIDTGADRTALSADALERSKLQTGPPEGRLAGVGGLVESVTVATQIQLTRDDGQKVQFRGTYAAFTSYAAMDMSVLGRDILDMFAVIVDRPAGVVAILGGNHGYVVHQR
jgi:hypothetical protein